MLDPLELESIQNCCKLPCEDWELIPGSLEEQQVFFTTEPYLQLHHLGVTPSSNPLLLTWPSSLCPGSISSFSLSLISLFFK